MRFLLEGTAKGEKGVLFTLEETPEQLRSAAASMGWDLAAEEKAGRLLIRYTSPVEMSTDRFLHEAQEALEQVGATRAVFDSLTTMALGVPSQRRYKELVYALAKHLRARGVTAMMTVESEQLLGSAKLSGQGVSFIGDNLVQLRYVEISGRLERAISVLKARGVRHETEMRGFTIGDGELKVVKDRFKDMRGVLTGLPTRDLEKI
jgi:circadian clock protein KaiC